MVEEIAVGIAAFLFGWLAVRESGYNSAINDEAVLDFRSLRDSYPKVYEKVKERINKATKEFEGINLQRFEMTLRKEKLKS